MQGRVAVDVHGVQVTLCCQQDLSDVNTARKSSPVQTNVLLLEGKRTEQRLFKTLWLRDLTFLSSAPAAFNVWLPSPRCSFCLGMPGWTGKPWSSQGGSSHSIQLCTPSTGRLHTRQSITFPTHTQTARLSLSHKPIWINPGKVTDMNKHAGKGWKLSFPSPNRQESYCASQGCKIKEKKSTARN